MRKGILLGGILGATALIPLLCVAEVPLPDDVRIVVPSPSLRKEVAAFSGKWSGNWSGILEAVLIVEEIDAEMAKIIYAWGDAPQWNWKNGFQRYAATVMPDESGEIRFGGRAFTVRMNGDFNSLIVTRSVPNRVDIETFRKVVP